MGPLPLDLERLQEHLGELLAELLLDAQLTPTQADPAPVVSAFGRVLETMARLDTEALRTPCDNVPAVRQAATTLGESANRLLKLAALCLDHDNSARNDQLALLHVGFAYWVARHGGDIPNLPALVEHLARLDSSDAITRFDPVDLTTAMLALIDSAAGYRRTNDPIDPRDPWRLLHLHACDAAQRTQRTDLIQKAHARLLRHLPSDVARCARSISPRPDATVLAGATSGTRSGAPGREASKPTLH